MRYLLLIATLLLIDVDAQGRMKRQSVDKQMADIIAEVGLKRLSDDTKDLLGKELIRLAKSLDSSNAKADIGGEVIAGTRGVPEGLSPAYNEGELADFMLQRADYLLKNKLRTDRAYASLCMAYVSAASALKPSDKRADKYLLELKKLGIGTGKRKPAIRPEGPAVAKGATPPIKHNLGLGYGREYLIRLYGKVKATSHNGDVETLYLSNVQGMHTVELHAGICRRLNLSIDKKRFHLQMGVYGRPNDDWKRIGVDKWRSKCGNFIAYLDKEGKLEAMYADLYEAKQAALAADTTSNGPTETIGAARNSDVKYRMVDYGIGTAYMDFARRYDDIGKRTYITKPSEYILEVKLNKRKYDAYIHFGRCRRVKTEIGSTKSKDKDAAVNKVLDIREEADDGWEKKSDTRWDSKDGKYIATVLGSSLSIWQREWYEKYRD